MDAISLFFFLFPLTLKEYQLRRHYFCLLIAMQMLILVCYMVLFELGCECCILALLCEQSITRAIALSMSFVSDVLWSAQPTFSIKEFKYMNVSDHLCSHKRVYLRSSDPFT